MARFKYYRYARKVDNGLPKRGFIRFEEYGVPKEYHSIAVFERMLSETEIKKFGLIDLNEPVKKLTRIRLSAGLRQSDLSEMTGISVRTIHGYEYNGMNGAPFRNVILIAKALHCNVMDLAEYNEKGELE